MTVRGTTTACDLGVYESECPACRATDEQALSEVDERSSRDSRGRGHFESGLEKMRELLFLIDTAGADGSLALASMEGEPRVLRTAELPGRSASERLFPELRRLLEEEGRTPREIAAIAVARGPGSFTGVRVGLAAAKGLAEALEVPVIGLSRLAVLAAAGRAELAVDEGRAVVSLLDAGRGELFVGRYGGGEGEPRELLLPVSGLLRYAGDALVVAAEPAVIAAIRAAEGRGGERSEEEDATAGEIRLVALDATCALRPAVQRLREGRVDDVALLEAHYLRRTPAERARAADVGPDAARLGIGVDER